MIIINITIISTTTKKPRGYKQLEIMMRLSLSSTLVHYYYSCCRLVDIIFLCAEVHMLNNQLVKTCTEYGRCSVVVFLHAGQDYSASSVHSQKLVNFHEFHYQTKCRTCNQILAERVRHSWMYGTCCRVYPKLPTIGFSLYKILTFRQPSIAAFIRVKKQYN